MAAGHWHKNEPKQSPEGEFSAIGYDVTIMRQLQTFDCYYPHPIFEHGDIAMIMQLESAQTQFTRRSFDWITEV